MSFGDQMMDEFGMVGKKKKSTLGMDKRKTLLALFAMHMADRYSIPFDEAILDAEIDEFLKQFGGDSKKESKKEIEEEEEEIHYLG